MRFDFDPTPGSVGGSVWAHAPVVNDPQLGRSRSVVPIINRIDVDDRSKLGPRMGVIAKETFFPNYPASSSTSVWVKDALSIRSSFYSVARFAGSES